MITANKITSECIDQHASLLMVSATHQDQALMDAEKLRHGNGPMPMICSSLTKSVFCHQLIEERLIMVVIRRSSSGPTLVILDKLSPLRSMAQRIRSLLKLWPRLQSTKFLSLLTSNLINHITGSPQVKTIPTVAVKCKPGNFHSVSMVTTKELLLNNSLLTWPESIKLVLPSLWQWDHGAHHSQLTNGLLMTSLASLITSNKSDNPPSVVTLMVSIGIGKVSVQKSASKVTAHVDGMTKSAELKLQKNWRPVLDIPTTGTPQDTQAQNSNAISCQPRIPFKLWPVFLTTWNKLVSLLLLLQCQLLFIPVTKTNPKDNTWEMNSSSGENIRSKVKREIF